MKLEDVVAVDVETTTADPVSDDLGIIQVSGYPCGKIDMSAVPGLLAPNSFDRHINPGETSLSRMSPDVMGIVGHNKREIVMLANDRDPATTMREFLEYLGCFKVITAHNWSFDLSAIMTYSSILGVECEIDKIPFIDTMRVCKEIYDPGVWTGPDGECLPDFKLGTCYYGAIPEKYQSAITGRPHDSLYDASMCSSMVNQWVYTGISIEELIDISSSPFKPRVCPIGQEHKGKKWKDVPRDFIEWMLKKKVYDDDQGFEEALLEEADRRGII